MEKFKEIPPVSEKIREFLFSHGYDSFSFWSPAFSAGSGRKYYRISGEERSAILQLNDSITEDFIRFMIFGKVFYENHLPTPRLYAVDETHFQILMEDMGHTTLLEQMQKDYPAIDFYPEVIERLVDFQNASSSVFLSLPELGERKFGYDVLKWETAYFQKNYLEKHCNVSEIPESVEEFFSILACSVDAHPKVLMHRDFQSQNILFGKEGKVGFVDFQGAYRGSLYYDLASLLWDPYVNLPVPIIWRLFEIWRKKQTICNDFSSDECWASFLEASLQRVMQALGAYCFLSKEKQLIEFEQYIKPGCARLKEVLKLYREVSQELDENTSSFFMEFL